MASKSLPKREQLPEVDKWRVEDIFATPDGWESAYAELKGIILTLTDYRGTLQDSAAVLLAFMRLLEEANKKWELVASYAALKRDEDSTVGAGQARYGRVQTLGVDFGQATSFFMPEILAIAPELIDEFMRSEPGLVLYAHRLEDIGRARPHTLDAERENLLAMSGEMAMGPNNIFSMLNEADLKFGTITDENGDEVELTKGRFAEFRESANREVRKASYETLYEAYGKQRNTLAAIYNTSTKADAFYAKVRNYESALHAAVFDDAIGPEVYANLVGAVRGNLDKMHKYVSLRKKALALEELHFYDLYVPIVKDIEVRKTFGEAKALCLEALRPLGSDYLRTLETAFASRWIDVYENEGKRSGAYSAGVYGAHPFVLLNYQGTLDDAFTLAHEMGHAMHSYYSQKMQPYTYSQYTIFLAEVASTLNETLMIRYLLDNTTDRQMRMYLINHYLEQFRGTLYRQTMFAEFEKLTHEASEAGETLTQDFLCDTYLRLNEQYYGPDIVVDDQIALEWARIPHFYTAFYVYQYSTGIAAATALGLGILREGQPAVDRYLEFLGSGSSDYSLNLLAQAGVDMRSAKPMEAVLGLFGEMVDELEVLMGLN